MTLTVELRGYPEAVLAVDSVTLDLPGSVTANSVIQSVARRSPRLQEALVHSGGVPRQSTKVLVDGVPVEPSGQVGTGGSVAVLAALPCDG